MTAPGSSAAHTELKEAIRLSLGKRPADVVLWPNEVGVAALGRRKVRYGLCNGSADLIGILRGGRFLAIEVKTGHATQSREQKLFQQLILRMGGVYAVARTVEDAHAAVDAALSHITIPRNGGTHEEDRQTYTVEEVAVEVGGRGHGRGKR